jgi:hypothetical protein
MAPARRRSPLRGLRDATLALACVAAAACGGHEGHAHGGDHPEHAEAGPDEHVHVAPHGGVLVALGDEAAHVELLLDRDAGTLTAWLLDGEAERALRSAQPALEVELAGADGPLRIALAPVASALTGETAGDTSQFAETDPRLAEARLEGEIARVQVLGRAFDEVAIEPER